MICCNVNQIAETVGCARRGGFMLRSRQRKIPLERGIIYGWVSKYREIKFPYTILKIISPNKKQFVKNFIHILKFPVNKHLQKSS
jgi:hypothetical protein